MSWPIFYNDRGLDKYRTSKIWASCQIRKLRVTHALRMPGTFPSATTGSDPDMHHGTCVTHVPWCMTGLLTSGFLWNWWRGKRSRHSRRMRNTQFHVSGKRPIVPTFRPYLLCCGLAPVKFRIAIRISLLLAIIWLPGTSCVILMNMSK